MPLQPAFQIGDDLPVLDVVVRLVVAIRIEVQFFVRQWHGLEEMLAPGWSTTFMERPLCSPMPCTLVSTARGCRPGCQP